MHQLTEEMAVKMEDSGLRLRQAAAGGMVIGYVELPAGTDFTPAFEGLPDDACHCPHWGYVFKGAVHLRYTDGSEEVTGAGEVFYWAPGHTAWVEEDTVIMDVSPEKELGEVLEHMARKPG